MKWFLAKLVFRIVCGSGNHTPQFDEQLRLIYAEDELHAFHKARLLGEGDCVQHEMENQVSIKRKFIDVTELHLLTCDTDGAEIYSIIKEEPDANLYIRSIQKSATQLLQQGLHQFTGLNSIAIGS
ncbi:DUF4288 domain-containing protein [Ferruginibacter sp.]|uniref:DUF4288 domain-containing protein n=1 Tax=Ferruginibacter sp. TaxID=1940288 RepID=UPI001998C24C|nr:DUF4288 domain-containing protein [Ferruginibacter sp.]MBC7626419.1 DUF4288 domain-containing protein [Ferruginibacter sp.]